MPPAIKKFNIFSEAEILQVASSVCSISPRNILLLGGGAVLPQVTGFQRLRGRSDDLEFVVNDYGIDALSSAYSLQPQISVRDGLAQQDGVFTYLNGIWVCIFINSIRGYTIGPEIYDAAAQVVTSEGPLHTIPPELNIALKIRRGLSNGHIYRKDGCDFASVTIGLDRKGRCFDHAQFSRYMNAGVCDTCTLSSPYECIDELEKGKSNLARTYFPILEQTTERCRKGLEGICTRM